MENQLELTNEFLKAQPVLERLNEAGYEAYFVGGSVRDALLGLPVNDVDIASSAMPEEVKTLFQKTIDVGIEHGTVMVLHQDESYEITTFRTESTYQDFRRPDSVSFVRSLEEDLKRRDFTINALALASDGQLTDLFNGQEDLTNQVIRAVGVAGERFNEDALRMMRAVRFAAQLGFTIEDETKAAIKRHAPLLEKISVERINVEWIKLLLSKDRKRGLDAVIETKLFENAPLLKNKKLALMYLANGKERIANERQAWALMLYYIRFLQPTHHKEKVSTFLKTWKTSNQMISDVNVLVEGLEKRIQSDELDQWAIYQNGLALSLEIEALMNHVGEESQAQAVTELYESLPIKSKDELNLSGHDLMKALDKKPGPWLGEALALAEREVLEGNCPNEKEILIKKLTQTTD